MQYFPQKLKFYAIKNAALRMGQKTTSKDLKLLLKIDKNFTLKFC